MAIGTYELWLDHWDGTRLTYIDDFVDLSYTRVMDGAGAINLALPSSFDDSLLQDDYKIEVWRALPGVPKRLENVYMIRGWRRWTDDVGVDKTTVTGVDGNDILKRRICLAQNSWEYAGSNDYGRKTDYAGNMVKQYMRDAMTKYVTGNIGGTVQRELIASNFQVQADTNDGSLHTENRACETLLDIANGITWRSTGRGFPIFWYVVPLSGAMYELRTYTPLLGQDLTNEVTINPDLAMGAASHERDAVDEFTAVFVRGGIISDFGRGFGPRYNSARWASTPFSYREVFVDAGSGDYDYVNERAEEEIGSEQLLPSESFACHITETDASRYQR